MSTTNTLKANLITDLSAISGIGDVLKVPTSLEETDAGTTGAVGIVATRGEDELDSFTNLAGVATQVFELQLAVHSSSDPNTASDALLDAVRNAIEADGSTIAGTATGGVIRVEQVTVTDWSAVEAVESVAEGWYIRDAEVTVVYYYNRGSA